jgi:hypothetical protein
MNELKKSLPEQSVYARASRLAAVRNAVSDVFGGRAVDMTDPADLRHVVQQVRNALTHVPDAYGTIIGGLAVQELGYVRWTEDVDVVVDAAHYREILEYLRNNGFQLKFDFTLQRKDSGVNLDLLREGATLKDSQLPLPNPAELGPNRGFATLAGVTRLKLDTNRMKDMADIVELFKPRLSEAAQVRPSIPALLLPKFDQLMEQARREAGA